MILYAGKYNPNRKELCSIWIVDFRAAFRQDLVREMYKEHGPQKQYYVERDCGENS